MAHTSKTLRIVALVAILFASVALSGCAATKRKVLAGISQQILSSGQEPYFNVGGVTYQVQESRALNAFDAQDVQYFTGLKTAQNISGGNFWYGVFLWAKNQNKQALKTSDTFELTDSQGNVYRPVTLNTNLDPYAWTQQTLQQNQIDPNPDSTAATGPTNGGLILFQLSNTAYQNRPLTLKIFAPGSTTSSASVSLDL